VATRDATRAGDAKGASRLDKLVFSLRDEGCQPPG